MIDLGGQLVKNRPQQSVSLRQVRLIRRSGGMNLNNGDHIRQHLYIESGLRYEIIQESEAFLQ